MHSESSSRQVVATAAAPDTVVSVRGVRKAYQIWNTPSARLRAFGLNSAARLLPHNIGLHRRLTDEASKYYRNFVALENISFDIKRGESVGIIGRNGSGKSTLLQIIVGTLQPSAGHVDVRGRVAALLELGSAFHPEFTGRENVYLNGAVLGFTQQQMDDLFDDIAAFADIGEFIDQPVKIYSSGMLLRLAFAVQVAVQPDVLVVDEALAVGDLFFQTKCYRRIRRMLDDGVTLLFVSHSSAAMRELCSRALLLDEGKIRLDGDPKRVLDSYFKLEVSALSRADAQGAQPSAAEQGAAEEDAAATKAPLPPSEKASPQALIVWQDLDPDPLLGRELFERVAQDGRVSDDRVRFINVQLLDSRNALRESFGFAERARLRLVFEVRVELDTCALGYKIRTTSGLDLVHCDTRYYPDYFRGYRAGRRYVLDWDFDMLLQHGHFHIGCFASIPPGRAGDSWQFLDVVPHAYGFSVAPRPDGMLGGLTTWHNEVNCGVVLDAQTP